MIFCLLDSSTKNSNLFTLCFFVFINLVGFLCSCLLFILFCILFVGCFWLKAFRRLCCRGMGSFRWGSCRLLGLGRFLLFLGWGSLGLVMIGLLIVRRNLAFLVGFVCRWLLFLRSFFVVWEGIRLRCAVFVRFVCCLLFFSNEICLFWNLLLFAVMFSDLFVLGFLVSFRLDLKYYWIIYH